MLRWIRVFPPSLVMPQSRYIVEGLSLWLWALFVLFIAVNSGISAPFQMAFMAKTCMPLTVASKRLACVQHTGTTHISQPNTLCACCGPVSNLECSGLVSQMQCKGLNFKCFIFWDIFMKS